jgi:hypothetical protein
LGTLVLLLGLTTQRIVQSAPGEKPGEYQVKAAIVFNLAKYVEWPAQSFADDSSPLILGILGEDKFGDDFRRMVEDKTINRRTLLVKHLSSGDDLKKVHLLFVSASERRRFADICQKVKQSSVVTVGEHESFIAAGGMINLIKKENRILPQINLAATDRAGLRISSKLLSIAEVVKPEPDQQGDR